MAKWIKMPLGTKVNLGPSEFVLHGVPAKMALSMEVGLGPGQFSAISIVAKRLYVSGYQLVRRWASAWATLC